MKIKLRSTGEGTWRVTAERRIGDEVYHTNRDAGGRREDIIFAVIDAAAPLRDLFDRPAARAAVTGEPRSEE